MVVPRNTILYIKKGLHEHVNKLISFICKLVLYTHAFRLHAGSQNVKALFLFVKLETRL